MSRARNLDLWGIGASTLCLVHCALLPLLVLAIPISNASADSSLGGEGTPLDWLHGCCDLGPSFYLHVGLLGLVIPLGLMAFCQGYRQHKRWPVLLVGLIGMTFLMYASLFGVYLWEGRGETVMTMAGSLTLVLSHYWNRRQMPRHRCPTPSGASLNRPTV